VERSKANCSIDNLQRLAEALTVSPLALLEPERPEGKTKQSVDASRPEISPTSDASPSEGAVELKKPRTRKTPH
jgi:hypothetical protein